LLIRPFPAETCSEANNDLLALTNMKYPAEGTRQFLVSMMLTGASQPEMESGVNPSNKSVKLTLRNEDESPTA